MKAFNQFTNAFVRQMGRETAHSAYKELSDIKLGEVVADQDFSTRLSFGKGFLILCLCLVGLVSPYLAATVFLICGLVRTFDGYIRGRKKVETAIYKTDRRYKTGVRYDYTQITWKNCKKPKEECSSEQISSARALGIVELVLSVIYFFVITPIAI